MKKTTRSPTLIVVVILLLLAINLAGCLDDDDDGIQVGKPFTVGKFKITIMVEFPKEKPDLPLYTLSNFTLDEPMAKILASDYLPGIDFAGWDAQASDKVVTFTCQTQSIIVRDNRQVLYTDPVQWNPDGNKSITKDEARQLADSFLSGEGRLPDGAKFERVRTNYIQVPGKGDLVESYTVYYRKMIDRVYPVIGEQAVVDITGGGDVRTYSVLWKLYNLPGDLEKIQGSKKAAENMKPSEEGCCGAVFNIDRIELGYYCPDAAEPEVRPVWIFFADEETGGETGHFIAVDAISLKTVVG
jgi:hypothetical protein